MTNPSALPTAPESPYAPLPVRGRGTLEIFDTAFKLLRRYAGVMLSWSFLSALIQLVPFAGGLGYIFTMPLIYGATACVIAAAVRGQKVTFGQVWGFTKPRYGALLGVLILGGLLFTAIIFAVAFAFTFLAILFAGAIARFGTAAEVLAWIVGILGGTLLTSLLLALTVGWFNLAPLVACLEDQNRGSSALSRAWTLLSGNWRKACAVAVILSLSLSAAFVIIGGFLMFLFYGGWDKFIGANADDSAMLGLLSGAGGFTTLFLTLSMPIQTLVIGVFYLDLRTHKEALDLEWTNYAAKPELTPEQLAAARFNAPPPFPPQAPAPNLNVTPSTLQAGTIGYAPGSSLPAASTPAPPSPPPFDTSVQAPPPVPVSPSSVQPPPLPVSAPATAPAVAAAPSSPVVAAPLTASSEAAPPTSLPASPGFAPALSASEVELPASVPVPAPVFPAQPASFGETPTLFPATPASEAAFPTSIPVAPTNSPATPASELGLPTAKAALAASEPPSFLSEAPSETEAAFPLPAPPQPAVPPAPPVPPAPSETSSFAPTRRASRDEDDDYPSSFGSGGHR